METFIATLPLGARTRIFLLCTFSPPNSASHRHDQYDASTQSNGLYLGNRFNPASNAAHRPSK